MHLSPSHLGLPLRGLGRISAIFDKEFNFCDFLFPFLHTKPLLERDLL